jgi:hypothetical protein
MSASLDYPHRPFDSTIVMSAPIQGPLICIYRQLAPQ